MVLNLEPQHQNYNMFTGTSRQASFNLAQYGYGGATSQNPQYPSGTASEMPAVNGESHFQQTVPPHWHSTVAVPMYPGASTSCAGRYEDWGQQPSSPSPCSHGQPQSPTTSTSFNYGTPYRLHSAGSPVSDYSVSHHNLFLAEMHGGHPSPDSGLAHSSDGVSGSDSPSTAISSSTGRPQPVRSPFEWMKKPSYQIQPAPGKTRTKDKYRVVYTDHQRLELEKEFHYSRYITIRRKSELAAILGLSERQVKIWFQNRRAKERKQQKKREELVKRGGSVSGVKDLPVAHFHPHYSLLGPLAQLKTDPCS